MQPSRRRYPRELLGRISHALLGYGMKHINTRWGECAVEAYDEIQPIRESVDPALRKARHADTLKHQHHAAE